MTETEARSKFTELMVEAGLGPGTRQFIYQGLREEGLAVVPSPKPIINDADLYDDED